MIIQRPRFLLALVIASFALPGCFFFGESGYPPAWDEPPTYEEDPYYYETPNEIPEPYNDGTLIVENSFQVGDMGEIRGYEGDAVASNATYYGSSSSLRLDTLTDNYWVMSYLSISNLDLIAAEPGTYRSNSSTAYDSTAVYISVTGCSGPSYGNYTFDAGSTEAEVTITDNGDGSRTLDVTARFSDYYSGELQTATAQLVYRQGEVAPPTTYTMTSLQASDAVQSGDMGDITGYTAPATASEGYYYGTSASIRFDSVEDSYWVMSYLSVNNFDLANAPAGTYTYASTVSDGTEPQFYVTGCSGPSYGNYTFDVGAEETTVVLTDNEDGSRTLDVTARFRTYSGELQTAQTSFRYTVAPTTTI